MTQYCPAGQYIHWLTTSTYECLASDPYVKPSSSGGAKPTGESTMDYLTEALSQAWSTYHVSIVAALALLILLVLLKWGAYRLLGVVVIGPDSVGIVTKKFARRKMPNGRVVALDGEAGPQAYTLTPNVYFGFWPWQFSVVNEELVEVEMGHVGVVEAIDGAPIPPGHVLGQHVECNHFQDADAFLRGGGQRGPQSTVLPPGTYRINAHLFSVDVQRALEVRTGMVAIVTTKDGHALPSGDIAGGLIEGHASFQDAHAFVKAGGTRGLQSQVLMPGKYNINPLFVEIEEVEMTDVPIGHVGVVISYVGEAGVDTTGAAFTHGNIVASGQRGVWSVPLDPGRYPINTKTTRIESVPTTNTVLNWIDGYSETHNLDKDLGSIIVRAKDGYSFALEVSQIIHIAAANAPRVIARFGTVMGLVTQVLEPVIDNYFRNAAQDEECLDFIKKRSELQANATKFVTDALSKLNVEGVNTLFGDIVPPPALMKTLTDRKLADEERTTFTTQRASQEERSKFEEAKAMADTRFEVVKASRAAEVAKLDAGANIERAKGQGEAVRINGAAEASRITAVGTAEAEVVRLKVDAQGRDNYSLVCMIGSLAEKGIPIVPGVSVSGSGGSGGSGGTLIEGMLASIMARREL